MCLYLWKILLHVLVYDLFRKIEPLNMCLYLWKILPHFLVYDLFRKIKRLWTCFFSFLKFVDMFIVSYISTWSAPKNACHGVNYKFNCQILVYTTFFSISWWSEITSAHDEGPVKGACQLYSRITRLFLHSHAPTCMSSRDV